MSLEPFRVKLIGNLVAMLWSEWKDLELQIVEMNDEVERIASSDAACRRLLQIPGIGPLVTTAIVASIGNGAAFRRDESSRPGWGCCRSSIRPVARRGCMESASAATLTCARS